MLQLILMLVDDAPEGYSQVAAFQSSDPSFLQYRGFGNLHCRVLSDLQHSVEQLEQELDDLDRHDKEHDALDRLQSKHEDIEQSDQGSSAAGYPAYITRSRPQVLRDLTAKLMEYGAWPLFYLWHAQT